MRHDRLVKAFEKAGHKINISKWNSNNYYAEDSKRIVSWYKQDDSAICVKSQRHNDPDDAMTDYSGGYFCHTIKEAVASLVG